MFAPSLLSQYMQSSSSKHFGAGKRVLRYIMESGIEVWRTELFLAIPIVIGVDV